MKEHRIWKKSASRLLSWLLVMAMMVTLPQVPTGNMEIWADEVTPGDGERISEQSDDEPDVVESTGEEQSDDELDVVEQTGEDETEGAYVTIHTMGMGWKEMAIYHWEDNLTFDGDYESGEIEGWAGATGELFKKKGNDHFSITVKGTFGEFLLLNMENPTNKTDDISEDVISILNSLTGETPTDVYVMYKDGKLGWYMDEAGTVTLESTRREKATDNVNGTTTFATVVNGIPGDPVTDESGETYTPYKDAARVELCYGDATAVENAGESVMTAVTMKVKDDVGTYCSDAVFLGDSELNIVYCYKLYDGDGNVIRNPISDGITKTINDVEYLYYHRDEFKGRNVYVPGSFPMTGTKENWDPASNQMKYEGNGQYSYTFKDVPIGSYEYKIAMGNWSENYGADGKADGSNMVAAVSKVQDVTVYYSDFSHVSRTSLDYNFDANYTLSGEGIPDETKFTDDRLTGVYSATVSLTKGSYSGTKIMLGTTECGTFDDYTLAADKKVTFYYDPDSGVYYSDASAESVNVNALKYDSKDTTYKNIYGAVKKGVNVTYSIVTGAEVDKVDFVIKGVENPNISVVEGETKTTVTGKPIIPMKKVTDGTETDDSKQTWSITLNYNEIGEYKYFFAVYSGTTAVMYGDDDGYYGTGTATNLLELLPYDQIVYEPDYKTPDWMKNAVIYQIFPDRFNNSDVTNDTVTSDARGDLQYEYMLNWSIFPENIDQQTINPGSYPSYAYKGDGEWNNEIYGGDIKGITERMDYLKALGVTVIYLNPVFESISSHRYDASDYMNIDPILGTLGDFEELVTVAKENGMHIVLDGVFNHVSDDSIYFDRYYKYLEEGTDKIGAYPYWAYVYDYMAEKNVDQSIAEKAAKKYFTAEYGITNYDYVEWFEILNTPLKDEDGQEVRDTIGHRVGKLVYGYEGWWGYDSMPVIKSTNNSEYQTGTWAKEIIGKNETSQKSDGSVIQYWLSEGANGWRIDSSSEVSDETYQHLRKSVKALNSDNVIIGEIWTDAANYLLGDMYDSIMNYLFRNAALSYAKGETSAEDTINTLERVRERYPEEAFYAMMNLVGSHDTTRVLSYLDGVEDDRAQTAVDKAFPTSASDDAKKKQYLVALMQFTYAGAPTVYYGDELGMLGADDPDDRRGMTWGEGDKNLVEWYATLAAIRNNYAALRTGTIEPVSAKNVTTGDTEKSVLSYIRKDTDDTMIVMMNNSGNDKQVKLTGLSEYGISGTLQDLLTDATATVAADGTLTVTVPAYNGLILTADEKSISIDSDALKPAYDASYQVSANHHAVKVTGVTLSKKSLALKPGETATLSGSVAVAPSNATTKTVKYASSNKKVATVDANGKITAVAAGKATITVKTNDGQFTANCEVTVSQNTTGSGTNSGTSGSTSGSTEQPKTISAKKVYVLDKTTIAKGKTRTLTATVFPKNTTDKITWSSSNKKVVTVDKNGKIKGIKTGTAKITAKSTSGKKATCKVTVVKKAKKSKSVKLNKKKLTLNKGSYTQLKATITSGSTDTLTWKSSNKKIATVDKNGVVVGVKKGTATITVKTSSGKKATCKVTVKVPATKVKLNKSSATLKKGKTLTLKAKLTPSNSTDTLTWKTSNKKVATVDKKGKVKGIKKGTATITVKTSSGKKATCKIKVK